jgi:hypothetical protein
MRDANQDKSTSQNAAIQEYLRFKMAILSKRQ